MKHKRWNIFFHELIGLKTRVLHHSNPSYIGIQGTITYETTKTLKIKTENSREVTILKPEAVLELELPSGDKIILKGDSILGDPAERSKRLKRIRR
jgi:RNase P/RNase MRP subunit p29